MNLDDWEQTATRGIYRHKDTGQLGFKRTYGRSALRPVTCHLCRAQPATLHRFVPSGRIYYCAACDARRLAREEARSGK